MKKSIYINQKIAADFDLTSDEAVLFDWIYENRNDSRYWLVVGRQFIKMPARDAMEDLPIVSKSIERIRKLYRNLELKGIIEYFSPYHHRDDYIWITEEGLKWKEEIE